MPGTTSPARHRRAEAKGAGCGLRRPLSGPASPGADFGFAGPGKQDGRALARAREKGRSAAADTRAALGRRRLPVGARPSGSDGPPVVPRGGARGIGPSPAPRLLPGGRPLPTLPPPAGRAHRGRASGARSCPPPTPPPRSRRPGLFPATLPRNFPRFVLPLEMIYGSVLDRVSARRQEPSAEMCYILIYPSIMMETNKEESILHELLLRRARGIRSREGAAARALAAAGRGMVRRR